MLVSFKKEMSLCESDSIRSQRWICTRDFCNVLQSNFDSVAVIGGFHTVTSVIPGTFLTFKSTLIITVRSELNALHCFELFAAGYSVPHAGPAKWIHVLHNDKRSLLQCYNGQVVILPGCCPPIQFIARPHMVFHGQRAVFPFTHLQRQGGQIKMSVL